MENKGLSNDLDGQSFENVRYDPSKSTENILLDLCDPNLNFYNINIKKYKYPVHYT